MKALTLAALIAAAPCAANADALALSEPLAGGTLRSETADMSVYWLPAAGEAIEVVAWYVAHEAPAEPRLVRMSLLDGEGTTFGLPGLPGTAYAFAREAGTLTVTAAPAPLRQALLAE